jgi:hypothetical protein
MAWMGEKGLDSRKKGMRCAVSTIPAPVSGTYLERDYRENDEYNGEGDGELKKGFFHAALGAIYRVRLAEDTSQTAATDLKQGHQYQGYGDDYLGDI